MRDIKFRAYNMVTKNMWWFNLMWGNMHAAGSGWIGMLETPDGDRRSPNGSDNRTAVDRDDCDIMQFTGLLDKNGKEIYEGDIVRSILPGSPELVKDFVIEWEVDKTSGTVGFTVLLREEDREVIGNIYENPELLDINN